MQGKDRTVAVIAAVMLAALVLTFLLPRWLTPADAGLAGGTIAGAVFLLGLAVVILLAAFLFVFTWVNRSRLSRRARMVGLWPLPITGLGFAALWANLVF